MKERSRVRHIDPEINEERGVMSIFKIKNGFAICGYLDFDRMHMGPWTYSLRELRPE